jgi:hypothetical protein
VVDLLEKSLGRPIMVKVTIHPRFSGTVSKIGLMSKLILSLTDFLKKIIHIEIYIEYEIYTD